MAWLTPDTEWSAGERLTYSDFNRICGNLNELAGDSALKTTWSEDDFLDLAAWKAVAARTAQLAAAANLGDVLIDTRVTAENIQTIEQVTARVRVYIDLVEENEKYPLYTNQVYAGTHLSLIHISASEIDEHEDLTLAVLVLVSDMFDNRQMTVDKSNVNRVVDTILGMYCTNMLG